MSYQVEISKSASKQLKKLPLDIQSRLESKIQQLGQDPRPDGVGKLKNGENRYRIRVGDYRILYQIFDDVLIVIVVRVGHRREVYKDE
ncbi:type II toxin-antitoxin system RelE family toxin [Nostoc sp. CCY 9925]|uniref:type II toxin-antitoxin system RelE family toxin n=1 Tax=Nostoc sp. CCY 9925 TaxID=3103865 RepID=UPI0039C5D539